MRDGEEGSEEGADAGYDYVGDAEEGVAAAYYGACADDDGFGAAVIGYVEICWVCVSWC